MTLWSFVFHGLVEYYTGSTARSPFDSRHDVRRHVARSRKFDRFDFAEAFCYVWVRSLPRYSTADNAPWMQGTSWTRWAGDTLSATTVLFYWMHRARAVD